MRGLSFERQTLTNDLVAGLTGAVVAIPDAMASAILAGVSPIHGLYALMVGTPVAALTTGSQFMSVVLTGAMALAVGEALAGRSGDGLLQSLIVLTVLVGVFQLLLGLLKLGGLTRFVSNAVMTGFLSGVAVLIILGQLGDFTGYSSAASNKVLQAFDLVRHLNQVDPPTLAIGAVTIVLVLVLDRTPLRNLGFMLAMISASVLAWVLGWDSIQLVGDIADIPRTFPLPVIPDLSLVPALLPSAMAIGIIGLVQGAGVSKGIPNPDGNLPDPSRDFAGQGVANVLAGLFKGMPLGGSLSGTAVNVSAGAVSRWANVFLGLLVVAIVLLLNQVVSLVAVPAMAALLIVAGFQTLNFEEIGDVWDVSLASRSIMVVTFAATLVLRIEMAVFLGVVVSMMHYLFQSSADIRVAERVLQTDGSFVERPAPSQLADNSVTLLQIYGNMFYAGAYRLEELLPVANEARRAVVILRLRGYSRIGSTFIGVIERYARRVQANGGRLMLVGLDPAVKGQLDRTETNETIADGDIFLAGDRVSLSVEEAMAAANRWLEQTAGNDGR